MISSHRERFDLDQVRGFPGSFLRRDIKLGEREKWSPLSSKREIGSRRCGATSRSGLWRERRHRDDLGRDRERRRRGDVIKGDSNSWHRKSLADGFSMGTSNVLSVRSTLTAATRPPLGTLPQRCCNLCGIVIAGLLPLSAYLFPFAEEIRATGSMRSRRRRFVRNWRLPRFVLGPWLVGGRIGDADARRASPASSPMQSARRPRHSSAGRPNLQPPFRLLRPQISPPISRHSQDRAEWPRISVARRSLKPPRTPARRNFVRSTQAHNGL